MRSVTRKFLTLSNRFLKTLMLFVASKSSSIADEEQMSKHTTTFSSTVSSSLRCVMDGGSLQSFRFGRIIAETRTDKALASVKLAALSRNRGKLSRKGSRFSGCVFFLVFFSRLRPPLVVLARPGYSPDSHCASRKRCFNLHPREARIPRRATWSRHGYGVNRVCSRCKC